MNQQDLADELEQYITQDHTNAPQEAVDLFKSESSDGIPTAIVLHPRHGWFVIQSSGQGPYIIWENELHKAVIEFTKEWKRIITDNLYLESYITKII